MRPLPKTHPQLCVVDVGPNSREYRVENWRVTHNGEGEVLQGAGFTWFDVVIICALGYAYWVVVSITRLPLELVFSDLHASYSTLNSIITIASTCCAL